MLVEPDRQIWLDQIQFLHESQPKYIVRYSWQVYIRRKIIVLYLLLPILVLQPTYYQSLVFDRISQKIFEQMIMLHWCDKTWNAGRWIKEKCWDWQSYIIPRAFNDCDKKIAKANTLRKWQDNKISSLISITCGRTQMYADPHFRWFLITIMNRISRLTLVQ
jgi:hypothetical protein